MAPKICSFGSCRKLRDDELVWSSAGLSEIKGKIIGKHYTLLEVKTTLTKLQSHHACVISEFLDNSNVNRSQPVQIISTSRRIDLQTAGSVKLFFLWNFCTFPFLNRILLFSIVLIYRKPAKGSEYGLQSHAIFVPTRNLETVSCQHCKRNSLRLGDAKAKTKKVQVMCWPCLAFSAFLSFSFSFSFFAASFLPPFLKWEHYWKTLVLEEELAKVQDGGSWRNDALHRP